MYFWPTRRAQRQLIRVFQNRRVFFHLQIRGTLMVPGVGGVPPVDI